MLINFIIAALALSAAGFIGYWAQDRQPPTEIKGIEIINSPVRPGGIARVQYTVNRLRACQVKIEQTLYDSQLTRYTLQDDDYITAATGIGPGRFVTPFPLDKGIAPGTARYYAVRSYRCNPLHYWFQWPIIVSINAEFEVSE